MLGISRNFPKRNFSAIKDLELTLGILKPDLTQHPFNLNLVREMIVENNFLVIRSKIIKMDRRKAEEFYAEHRGKFFFNRLVSFMTSGPCQPLILAKENSIQSWRELMGPTKVFKSRFSDPESIRGRFGLTDTRNSSHGSDSVITAEQEMKFFFPEFSPTQFYAAESRDFCHGNYEFDAESFVHKKISLHSTNLG